jgi:hypothetical protein
MFTFLLNSILGGLLATLFMDVTGTLVRVTGLTAGAPPSTIGKWFTYLLQGRLVHRDIMASPDIPIRMPSMVAFHYGIGIALAGAFVALCSWQMPQRGTFAFAVGFGLLTTVLAWFLMFPAMGWGVAGTRGPAQLLLTRTSLVNHALYGLGLALWTVFLAPLLIRSNA